MPAMISRDLSRGLTISCVPSAARGDHELTTVSLSSGFLMLERDICPLLDGVYGDVARVPFVLYACRR
jgi:hypothetical protein